MGDSTYHSMGDSLVVVTPAEPSFAAEPLYWCKWVETEDALFGGNPQSLDDSQIDQLILEA